MVVRFVTHSRSRTVRTRRPSSLRRQRNLRTLSRPVRVETSSRDSSVTSFGLLMGRKRHPARAIATRLKPQLSLRASLPLVSGEAPASTVGVVTPYNAQATFSYACTWAALARCVSRGFVASVNSFQGGARDYIVMSTVRTGGKLGFVRDPRRLNVGLTRARLGLITLGHVNSLSSSDDWAAYLGHMATRGAVFAGELGSLVPYSLSNVGFDAPLAAAEQQPIPRDLGVGSVNVATTRSGSVVPQVIRDFAASRDGLVDHGDASPAASAALLCSSRLVHLRQLVEVYEYMRYYQLLDRRAVATADPSHVQIKRWDSVVCDATLAIVRCKITNLAGAEHALLQTGSRVLASMSETDTLMSTGLALGLLAAGDRWRGHNCTRGTLQQWLGIGSTNDHLC